MFLDNLQPQIKMELFRERIKLLEVSESQKSNPSTIDLKKSVKECLKLFIEIEQAKFDHGDLDERTIHILNKNSQKAIKIVRENAPEKQE